MTGLQLAQVQVGYRDGRTRTVVLPEVTATARRGEFTALIGPNGTGKSTLLRTVAGLQPAFGGSILLDGARLDRLSAPERARLQAIVLTERVAPGRLTAWEMVALGRHPHTGFLGRLDERDEQLVAQSLAAVGVDRLAERDISELSDGERQRVMTARALAQRPRLLLMDEPSAFLDAPGRVALAGLLRRVAREQDVVAVVSTHEVELALQVADRIWLLDRGGVLHSGTPEEVVASGLLGRVFDSDDLVFDPVAGLFTLVGEDTGTARVAQESAPELDRLLKRLGWRRDDEGPAAIEVSSSGSASWQVRRAGASQPIDGLASLAAALSDPPATRGVLRVGPGKVREAVAQAGAVGSYFAVDLDAEPAACTALGKLSADRLRAWGWVTCRRLDSTELRVGVSTWQFGLVARVWSVLVGSWARGGVLPDLRGLGMLDRLDQPALTLQAHGGWYDESADATLVAHLMAQEVVAVTDTLHVALREHLALGLLEGNRAAAAIGAVRAVRAWRARGADEDIDRSAHWDLEALATALQAHPIVADHHDADALPTASGDAPPQRARRRSCCLYYRTPTGGTCGDCPLAGRVPARRPTREATSTPAQPTRRTP